jgi:mannose-6-phosphate isomerase-like protein (cupin superfamily)
MPNPFDLASTFVHLGSDHGTVPLEVTETFWQDLEARAEELGAGRLLSLFAFDAAWDVWEVHPNGDEIVLLLSGSAQMTLEGDDDQSSVVELREPGSFVLIPRGTWHTARTEEPTRMLFVTDGEGTQHRPA